MKVRTKLALLLAAVVATFVLGLIAVKAYDRRGFREVAAAREQERQLSFDQFVRHWSEPLETFATYFSAWDEMVGAIQQPHAPWIEANLHNHTLASYRSCTVWAYRPDGVRAFSRNLFYSDVLAELPLTPEALRAVMRQPRSHFFVQMQLGLMEIRGTSVHPSKDSERATAPRGYFFAGRLWTRRDLEEMALFTGNTVHLVNAGEQPPPLASSIDAVTFSRPLPGWDGQPVATLLVRNDSKVVEQLHRSSQRLFGWMFAFALVLVLTLLFSLRQWVSRPLKTLCRGLQNENLEAISGLKANQSEFGDFARMIEQFFAQRQSLLREVTERQQTQEALRQSEERLRHSQKMEAVGRLAGGIAHDFNNLLTAIIGYAELIALRTEVPALREDADLIRKAGEQAAALTRQLLAFSRKQILQPRVIDLNELVCDMQKLLERVIGENIELSVSAGATHGRVRADPTQLQQVILNLGVNARDAMPHGGALTMRVRNLDHAFTSGDGSAMPKSGRFVALSVEDTGSGMDKETQERVFEPFFTTKAAGKGTGLGLATVYGIVQQSGGSIRVESELGKGTTFTIYFPEEDAEVDPPQEPQRILPRSRKPETILVVEDEEIVRELVCTVLADQGYHVLCAENGPEALRLSRAHSGPIDLLLSDVVMPRMNGPEVARTLTTEHPKTRVLFVSGYSDNDISDRGIIAPGIRFLEKPFTPEALCRKIREVLDETEESVIA
ncbi:MAG TPA: ATP-binding protein [Chthoniobacteraceae bacterium]|jgi:signal transduction histidine kinase/ActR/RegA family two-component response regulator